MLMLVGTYTRNTDSAGIYGFRVWDDWTGFTQSAVNAGIDNPSWLAMHPRLNLVYAVNEVHDIADGGAISAFTYDPQGHLSLVGQRPSMGADPCHLAVNPAGTALFVSNYGGGNLAGFPLTATGEPGALESLVQHGGKGIDAMRQKGPHVHSIALDSQARFAYVCDLGLDRVVRYTVSGDGSIQGQSRTTTRLKPGAGPRMLDFDSRFRFGYLINELDNTIVSFERDDAGNLVELSTCSALPADYTDASYCAHIRVSRDDRFLYASNRGHDSIAVFGIDGDGRLELVQHQPTLGKHPRYFTFSPDERNLLVANRDSNNIIVMERDAETGMLAPTGTEVRVPAPVCIEFAR